MTTPHYRSPNGTSFTRPTFDQPLSVLSILFAVIDNACQPQPTRHHWRGASRDLLLQVLSIISFKLTFKLTTPHYRGPNGTSFARTSFDQPLSALSILFAVIDNTCQPQPAGRDYATHPATYCCKYCRFSKQERGIPCFENSSFVSSCA